MLSDVRDCGISANTASLVQHQELALEAEQRTIDEAPGLSGVDFAAELCPKTNCSAEQDGLWIYRDSAHLSVPGSLQLTESFRRAMVAALSA